MNPLAWLDDEAAIRSAQHLERRLRVHDPKLVNFASNDYLGLASHPEVVEAACAAAREYGWGAGASPLVCGWHEPHEKLARELADFEQVESVLLFPSGFAANQGTIAALAGPGDAVYCDRLNHASLIAGVRLSGAKLRVYDHANTADLAHKLARERVLHHRVLIVTDGVFSMDGDLAPLGELADLADRYEATLVVDEAHGTGVLGTTGRGACEDAEVEHRVAVRIGTLSKSLGSIGGFLAGSKRLTDHVLHRAPTFVYSTALPSAAAAAASAALRILRAEPERRGSPALKAHILGLQLGPTGFSAPARCVPIMPVLVGDAQRTLDIAVHLREQGFLVGAIRPPTVPRGTSRLRISVTYRHTEADLNGLLGALRSSPKP